jgi:hypothetical protein
VATSLNTPRAKNLPRGAGPRRRDRLARSAVDVTTTFAEGAERNRALKLDGAPIATNTP